jgi:hypothetical protein
VRKMKSNPAALLDPPNGEYAFGICLGELPPVTTSGSSEFAWLIAQRITGMSRDMLKQSGYELVWLCIQRLPIPEGMERVSR